MGQYYLSVVNESHDNLTWRLLLTCLRSGCFKGFFPPDALKKVCNSENIVNWLGLCLLQYRKDHKLIRFRKDQSSLAKSLAARSNSLLGSSAPYRAKWQGFNVWVLFCGKLMPCQSHASSTSCSCCFLWVHVCGVLES